MDEDYSISLPKWTILQGKEDICSPFYTTYSTEKEMIYFYNQQLEKKVSRGQIKSYKYLEDKGYIVELTSEKMWIYFILKHLQKN
ncbi:hypothetical protein E3U55_06390 [Filobacillus milosensis]|uniref:Uncharacterized protein n=1 Tax=Filobacillus milosensis TaxID=94137 RepID=A0A4Y8IQ90_9BACI|nr:hypothetical protein E3U55_06390 [Filobacillus milosensis]